MPRITISRETARSIRAFQTLSDQLLGESLPPEQCAEALILTGLRAILDGLWRQHNPDILIETLQKLAARFPEQVYPFLAEVLVTGERIKQERAREAPVLGFRSQPGSETPAH